MNWMKCSKEDIAQTEDDLKHYTVNRALIENLKSEIEELFEDLAGLKAVDLTKDRVQGGPGNHNAQDNISILIDEKQKRLKRAAAAVARVDRAMGTLREEEREVIRVAFIDRAHKKYIESLANRIGYQPDSIKKIRYNVIRKMTYTLYGIRA